MDQRKHLVFVLIGACLSGIGSAQNPDVAVFLDLRPTLTFGAGYETKYAWYDLAGRPSLAGVNLVLPNGNRAYVAQRLQRMPGTADPDSIDEYYLEDTGRWRIGKQTLPFGSRTMMSEKVAAIRFDSRLLVSALPFQVAYCDAGPGRERGVAFRVGRGVGVSGAFGNNFGIQASSFTQFRTPSDAPGKARGHRQALGLDATVPLRNGEFQAEYVGLRSGETALDLSKDLTDLRFIYYVPGSQSTLIVGWSRDWTDGADFFRVEGEFSLANKVRLVPFVRFDGSKSNFGASVRVKL